MIKPRHAWQRTLANSRGADDDRGCGSVALPAAPAEPPPRVCRNEVGRAPPAAAALSSAACGADAGADAGAGAGAAAGTPAIACRAAHGVSSKLTGQNAAA